MALRYVIKASTGRVYKGQDGTEKTEYIDIGVIMDGKSGGFVLKMKSIPIGWDGWGFLNEPEARPRGAGVGGQRRAPAPAGGKTMAGPGDELDDDIPF